MPFLLPSNTRASTNTGKLGQAIAGNKSFLGSEKSNGHMWKCVTTSTSSIIPNKSSDLGITKKSSKRIMQHDRVLSVWASAHDTNRTASQLFQRTQISAGCWRSFSHEVMPCVLSFQPGNSKYTGVHSSQPCASNGAYSLRLSWYS